ncbi:MAG: WYL domain-containing protein [Actinobacteria bacterium]|nr:WYL domain-containing protein [Actinomycetota bacterium]MBU1943494.1 WYL domain-containing protein [Actinomycetota bacterium]MBU2686851.1 WYL domain-containing protein [Actinomycetota bacterium]
MAPTKEIDYHRHPVQRLIALTCFIMEASVAPSFEELKASPVYAAEQDARRKRYRVLYDILILPEERQALLKAARRGIDRLTSDVLRLERIEQALDTGRVPTKADIAFLTRRLADLDDGDDVRVEMYTVKVRHYRSLLDRFERRADLGTREFTYLGRLVASEATETRRMLRVLEFVRDEMTAVGEEAERFERMAEVVKEGGRPPKADLDFLADRVLGRSDEDKADEAAYRAKTRRFQALIVRLVARRKPDPAETSYLYWLLVREGEGDACTARDLQAVSAGKALSPPQVDSAITTADFLARHPMSLLEEKRETDRIRAMFERDKSVLLEMGVPLEVVTRQDGQPGYRIAAGSNEPVKLGADERLAMATALRFFLGSGTPFSGPAMTLLLKLGYRCSDLSALDAVPVSWLESPPTREALNRLTDAVRRKKSVTFSYRSLGSEAARRHVVEPYGMISRDGRWYLVGRSDLHEGVVTFKLDRLESKVKVNEARPKSADFRVPPGFDVEKATTWAWDDHATDVKVRFGPRRDGKGRLTYAYDTPPASAPAVVKRSRVLKDRSLEVVYEVDYLYPFVDWLLGFGTDARAVTPREVVKLIKERLQAALKVVG